MNFKHIYLPILLLTINILLQSCGVKGDPVPAQALNYPSVLEKYTQHKEDDQTYTDAEKVKVKQ